ncbi:DUF1257 domain-containing protein [Halalkalibacterium halodurans]|jgi:4-amino-4-deoxy-L-arabinose transferase-like glycosyltransferase|uniref:DUF1257 domain-containing protein n=1 Tax=Halalkalibacterium halodurans TaxID=86665 RepID=A0A0M0KFY9_ALKHA|nr:DUF1257 domain-containing protein [Halalkalibacterium halodurans]MDY7224439.1 DUF1257 domain-containing protein [Halalkalibacterium halodurans]MDY7243724.1 DUF1257 domain-containing protein [Halalkalibacterium halodurans]MED4163253.1 DUF1257 domain-containing protein [Halalkalibacterium halodurans]
MSIELILIPIGIAVGQKVATLIDKRNENKAYTIQTVMKKEHLLKKAIEQYGCSVQGDETNYQTEVGDIKIGFYQNEEGVFEAIFDESVEQEHALEFIENLHTEYKYLIQQETYTRLVERAKKNGLELESEAIQKDRSILLTFEVQS